MDVPQNLSESLSEIYSFRDISERLGTAGQPTESQFRAVKKAGFEAVINLALPTSDNALANEGSIVTDLGMTYVHIPVDFKAPTSPDFHAFSRRGLDDFDLGMAGADLVFKPVAGILVAVAEEDGAGRNLADEIEQVVAVGDQGFQALVKGHAQVSFQFSRPRRALPWSRGFSRLCRVVDRAVTQ